MLHTETRDGQTRISWRYASRGNLAAFVLACTGSLVLLPLGMARLLSGYGSTGTLDFAGALALVMGGLFSVYIRELWPNRGRTHQLIFDGCSARYVDPIGLSAFATIQSSASITVVPEGSVVWIMGPDGPLCPPLSVGLASEVVREIDSLFAEAAAAMDPSVCCRPQSTKPDIDTSA